MGHMMNNTITGCINPQSQNARGKEGLAGCREWIMPPLLPEAKVVNMLRGKKALIKMDLSRDES